MGTENSSEQTKLRAKQLAGQVRLRYLASHGFSTQIGSYHLAIVIDAAVKAVLGVFSLATNCFPRFMLLILQLFTPTASSPDSV